MGLIQFVKDAGEKLLDRFTGDSEEEKAAKKAAEEAAAAADTMAANAATGRALHGLVQKMGFSVENFGVGFTDGRATLSGVVPSQDVREKIVLVVGNTAGVAEVDDQLEVKGPPPAVMYTVAKGDSLSKIAKEHYGDPMKYPVIFEANRPMLSHPDKIYPGQVLRIPPIDGAPLA